MFTPFNSDAFFVATVVLSTLVIVYAYLKGKIELSALLASGAVGLVAIYTVGINWLYVILAFFVYGNLVTRYKYSLKEKAGIAQKVRDFRNVFGNGGAAMVFGILYFVSGDPLFLLGFLGAMSTACADTFATELGEIYGKEPVLITTLKKTTPGTDGGISVPGSFAALLGASLISMIPLCFELPAGLNIPCVFYVGVIGGFFGSFFDSFIGATLEGKRAFLDNHMTNFLATFGGGVAAILLSFVVF